MKMREHAHQVPNDSAAPHLPAGIKAVVFVLSAVLAAADQLIKHWITESIPVNTIGFRLFGGDFIRIIHVKNNAVAFSLGTNLPDAVRIVLFIAVPLILITAIIIYVLRGDEFTLFQRWCIAALVGGGIGNLIDRIFRSGLVIDDIDVKFYGLFGLERFPTFNLADSSIVVGGILLMGSFLFAQRNHHE